MTGPKGEDASLTRGPMDMLCFPCLNLVCPSRQFRTLHQLCDWAWGKHIPYILNQRATDGHALLTLTFLWMEYDQKGKHFYSNTIYKYFIWKKKKKERKEKKKTVYIWVHAQDTCSVRGRNCAGGKHLTRLRDWARGKLHKGYMDTHCFSCLHLHFYEWSMSIFLFT